jgi:hypothetical protein
MVFVEYPIQDLSVEKTGKATFNVLGDSRLSCRLRLIPTSKKALPELEVHTERYQAEETLKGQETPEGHIEYELFGDREVTVRWVSI